MDHESEKWNKELNEVFVQLQDKTDWNPDELLDALSKALTKGMHLVNVQIKNRFDVGPTDFREIDKLTTQMNKWLTELKGEHELLSGVKKLKLTTLKYLRTESPGLKVDANNLHTLAKPLKQKGRDFLNLILGENPKKKEMIDEVFRKPKKSRRRDESAWKSEL